MIEVVGREIAMLAGRIEAWLAADAERSDARSKPVLSGMWFVQDDRGVDGQSFEDEQAQASIRWASATMTPSGPRT